MTAEKGLTTVSEDTTTFPSITFPATFEGTAAIGADFSATLKLKTSDGPGVLEDLKALPRGTYDVTIVSRQGALAGDSIDRAWAEQTLDADEDGIPDYGEHCIGSTCQHFGVATRGELEGAYVCNLDPEAPVKIVRDETECPLRPGAEPVSNGEDDGVEHLDFDPAESDEPADSIGADVTPAVYVLWPGETETVRTEVGEKTRFSELIFDYLAQNDPQGDEGDYRVLDPSGLALDGSILIPTASYGCTYTVEKVEP